MKVQVYAKLNLSLNVYPKEGNFHPIDSVVTSVNIFDIVEVKVRKDKKIKLKGFMPTVDNIAYKTAKAFMEKFTTNGVDISITKGIPIGAGMGGSSADSAGVLYCMCKLFSVDINNPNVSDICKSLGSDITFMLKGGLALMQGKGDDVIFVQTPLQLYFVLTCFTQKMSTADVYGVFDDLPEPLHTNSQQLLQNLQEGNLTRNLQNNNLQPACQSLSSYAQSYLQCAKDNGFLPNMTGSGSAYYIWCKEQEESFAVCQTLKSQGYNSKVVKSISFGIEMII